MSTYKWSIPSGKEITGSTYLKDTDNYIGDTIDDLVDFVNGEGVHLNQGMTYDFVDKTTDQTITGVKTFSNGLIGNVTGNVTGTVSGNSGTATKLATARTITLAGDVTGSVSFDGSANVNITTTVGDDSHNHSMAYIAGLQTALDGKLSTSGNAASATYATNSGYATNAGNADTVDGYHASTLLNNYDNSHSLSTVGYQKFANGLIFQWGTYSGSSGSTISYPISFPNAVFSVTITPRGTGSVCLAGVSPSTTSFTWHDANHVESIGITWFAVGN